MTYKFTIPALPARFSNAAGLKYRAYNVYSGSASNSPLPGSLVSGSLSSTAGLSTQINNFAINATTTYVWRGYFKPDATSTSWQFRTTSKDGSYVWLDSAAENPVASLDPASAIVDNGGTHSSTTVESSNQSLDSQFHYVITLVAGSNVGSGNVTLEWRRDGGAWESSGSTYLSSDNRYADGLGEDLYTASATPASYWVVGFEAGSGDFGYAANTDRTSWTIDDRVSGNATAFDAAYGKDGSGNGIFIITNASTSKDVTLSSTDITDDSLWSTVNLSFGSAGRSKAIAWSNDSTNSTSGVWMLGTNQGEVWRSTNGGTVWSKLTSGNMGSGANAARIFSLAGNGSGRWAFVQADRLHYSTNDGASFTSSTPFTNGGLKGVAFTNSTLVVVYQKSGEANLFLRTAAETDVTSWSDEVDLGIAKPVESTQAEDYNIDHRANLAAASGRVVITSANVAAIARIDVDGTTTSNLANPTYAGPAMKDVTTDGNTWMAVTAGGDIYESTNNGETWTETVDNILVNRDSGAHTGDDITCVAASKYLPL